VELLLQFAQPVRVKLHGKHPLGKRKKVLSGQVVQLVLVQLMQFEKVVLQRMQLDDMFKKNEVSAHVEHTEELRQVRQPVREDTQVEH